MDFLPYKEKIIIFFSSREDDFWVVLFSSFFLCKGKEKIVNVAMHKEDL